MLRGFLQVEEEGRVLDLYIQIFFTFDLKLDINHVGKSNEIQLEDENENDKEETEISKDII